jgi:phosphoglycerate dehydrogenase-like enzyme
MKPNVIVVNVSAAELVDREALARALKAGTLGGAAVDVIGSGDPYGDMPMLTMTPARGWYTPEGMRRRAETWLATLAAYSRGERQSVVV